MRQISRAILAAAAVLPLCLAPPIAAAKDDGATEGERILPNEEDLRALGDLAEQMMRRFAEKLDPLVESLRELIDDIDAYEAPERLPNGDIIIRRKPQPKPDPPPPDEGVEL